MAKLRIELDIPDWSIKQLQDAVADLDELDAGKGQGIRAEYVTAFVVLNTILADNFNPEYHIVTNEMI